MKNNGKRNSWGMPDLKDGDVLSALAELGVSSPGGFNVVACGMKDAQANFSFNTDMGSKNWPFPEDS